MKRIYRQKNKSSTVSATIDSESLSMASRRRKSQAKPAHLLRYRRGIPGDYTERDRAICQKRAEGLSYNKIGLEYGLSHTRVADIVRKQQRSDERAKRLAPLKAAFARSNTS
jgi:DNA-binding NarL/FixJ family response regulator